MNKPLQAYLNDPKLKEEFLNQIRNHQEQDRILQGTYGDKDAPDFKGCAVGCSIRSLNIIKGKKIPTNKHAAYEDELGIPRVLAHLEDRIFEGLPVAESKKWTLRFAEAINVGADLSLVVPRLMLWVLSDEQCGVLQYAKTKRSKQSIQTVIALYKRKLSGETVTDDEWVEARRQAYAAAYAADADAAAADAAAYAADADAAAADAAAYAADAAAYAADAAAAADAADAAADAADAAAAAAAAAWRKAKQKRFKDIADKLIELLAEADS